MSWSVIRAGCGDKSRSCLRISRLVTGWIAWCPGFGTSSSSNPDMRVALPDVGRCGKLDLVFALRGGQTILSDFYCEVPFKITRALSTAADGVAHVMLMHCTAGLFGGDRVEMRVLVERGARVRLTQQSATRVHPSEGRIAAQTSRIHVESGGELELLLDPVIPFAESRFEQKTLIEVEKEALLRYWEGLMA